jgi:hypothetical protein
VSADLERIASALENVRPILHRQARTIVLGLEGAGAEQARRNLTEQGAIDTRGTLDGVQASEPEETENGWRGEVRATALQSIFVERGRRAGARMPPGGVLLGWMGRHGIPPRAEFVIRRAIGRRGIRARPFMSPLAEQLQPQARRLLAEAGESIHAELRGY